MGSPWYVIQVMTGSEHRIAAECEKVIQEEGEQVFVLLRRQEKKIRGKLQEVQEILFPGYLFFETQETETLPCRLRQIPGTARLLQSGEEICPISPQEREFLLRLGGEEHMVDTSRGIVENDEVIITQGPLQGIEGSIVRIDRHKRLAFVKVQLLGREVKVKMGLEIVAKK